MKDTNLNCTVLTNKHSHITFIIPRKKFPCVPSQPTFSSPRGRLWLFFTWNSFALWTYVSLVLLPVLCHPQRANVGCSPWRWQCLKEHTICVILCPVTSACLWDSPIVCVLVVCSFVLLNGILLCESPTICCYIFLLRHIWVISCLGLLCLKSLWTFSYKYFFIFCLIPLLIEVTPFCSFLVVAPGITMCFFNVITA